MTQPGPKTVLVVDDDEPIRELARRRLERDGYRVLAVGSGDEALRMVESDTGAVDLLIADIVLPGMSGATLARRIKERRAGTPVLFLSGYAEQAGGSLDLGDLGVGGDVAFLAKPFTAESLAHAVRSALDPRPTRQQEDDGGPQST
jgi:two-component system, cell cycle sensor histidine kinase and response regulator CckA